MKKVKIVKKKNITVGFGILLLILIVFSVMAGRYFISWMEFTEIIRALCSGVDSKYETAQTVLFQSRIPRVIVAVLIGCGLSVSGAAYQGIFRNPMVSPDLLGASAGAGFGAALGFLFELPTATVQIMAFLLGIIAVVITIFLSNLIGGRAEKNQLLLVLSGIVVGSLFQAMISMVKYVADPFDTMPSISFWLMGGLTYVTADDLLFLAIPIFIGTTFLLLIRWRINLLSFGNDEAEAMGISVHKYRIVIILAATFMTASCVAVGGMIGWAGMIVPHFARMIKGPDYRKMLPCCAVLGGIFLLFVDDIARCAFPQELPIGILTAIIGAPVFVGLLVKGKKGFL